METRVVRIPSNVDPNVVLRVIPGHFATTHSHINYYVDMTFLKARKSEAEGAAKILARNYEMTTYIDTIVCMDGCEIIGAYLAEQLTRNGIMSINAHQTMYVVSPEIHTGGQLIFRDNMQSMIQDKHVLLVLATATTGITVKRAVECIRYYGGIVEGAAALFSATEEIDGVKIKSLFTPDDIPDYKTYHATECPLCKEKKKLDAIVNSYGYSRM
ncbi:MAG: orotate phosphoribosyltransferase [Eubacteriales bacterium]|nr:orotate phosphoribosyltransferase [Eubacteriales bacterium]